MIMKSKSGKIYYGIGILLAHLLWMGYATFGPGREPHASLSLLAPITAMTIQITLMYLTLCKRGIVSERASNIFLLLCVLLFSTHVGLMQHAAFIYSAILVELSLIFLLRIYHSEGDAMTIGLCGFLLGVAALLWPPIIYTLPIWVFFLYILRSISVRQITALFFGLVLSFWIFATPLLFLERGRGYLAEIPLRLNIWSLPVIERSTRSFVEAWFFPLFLLILLLWAISRVRLRAWTEKVQLRSVYALLMIYPIFLLAFYAFAGEVRYGLLYLSLLPAAVILGRAFDTLTGRFRLWSILFVSLVFTGFLGMQLFYA